MIPDEGVVILIVAGALFAIGLASLIARSNLIKMVMGLELLGKGVSLLFVLGGYLSGDYRGVPGGCIYPDRDRSSGCRSCPRPGHSRTARLENLRYCCNLTAFPRR